MFRNHLPGSFVQFVAACLLLLLVTSSSRGEIVFDNESNIRIQYAGPAADDLVLAGDLIAKYLPKIRQRGGLAGPGESITFLLNAKAESWQQLTADQLQSVSDMDAYTITIPQSNDEPIRIEGSTVMSVSYGVMHMLEKHFGITWLFPGDLGVDIPHPERIVLKPDVTNASPVVTSRLYTGMIYYDPVEGLPFRQKYRDTPYFDDRIHFSAFDYFKSLRLHNMASPSHNMINIFPVDDFLDEHPNIRPMLSDGSRYVPETKRTPDDNRHQHWHPCYTEPMVAQIATQKARAAFENGAFIYSLGINDGIRQQCQCERCLAVGWPASYYQFVTKVANGTKDFYPPRLIGVLVYGDVRQAPDDLELPENVLAMVTGSSPLTKWSKHVDHIGRYGYFYGSGFIVPSFPLKSMKWNAQIFKRYGVRSFRAEVGPVWAFDGPKVYLQSKLLWDPDLDVDAALTRWCNAAFGEGGPAMKGFYLHWASKWDYLVDETVLEPAPYCDMGKWRSMSAQLDGVNSEDYTITGSALAEAEKLADAGSKAAERLRMVRAWWDVSDAYFRATQSVDVLFSADGSPDDIKQAMNVALSIEDNIVDANKRIEDNPEWGTGTKDYEDNSGYSIENELKSGLTAGIIKLRRAGKLSQTQIKSLPENLVAIATEPMQIDKSPIRVREMDHGIYYALERTQNRHSPMAISSEPSRFFVKTDDNNPRRDLGDDANEEVEPPFKRQWAFAMLPNQTEDGRRIYEFNITATGKQGELTVYISNPWVTDEDEGLPLRITMQFGDKAESKTRHVLAEPVGPKSKYYSRHSALRYVVLWDPKSEEATCEITNEFQRTIIEVKPPKKDFPTDPFAM